MTTGELLDALRCCMDRLDALNKQMAGVQAERRAIEDDLRTRAEAEGVDRFGNEAMTVTFSEDFRVAYDPERWSDVVRWAVESGNDHIIQRRITDARVKSLIDDGVPMPEGLRLEPFTKVSVRRVNK